MPHPFSHRALATIPAILGAISVSTVAVCADATAATVVSAQSGQWSDSTTWEFGIPAAGDEVVVASGHSVVFDLDLARVAGVTVEDRGTLAFDPEFDSVLESSGNVVIHGRLEMKPTMQPNMCLAPAQHVLRFVDVDETAFVDGGMEVLDSDVGLWARRGPGGS